MDFCSVRCQKDYLWLQRKALIEQTGAIPDRCNQTRVAKRYLVETQGHKCRVCGISAWLGQRLVMILDHPDGNAFNFLLTNLRLICPNCDSQTSNWKSKNNGHGRGARRKLLEGAS